VQGGASLIYNTNNASQAPSDASHAFEALKIEALERVEKRVLQYKHRAARPAAYTIDEGIKLA
jgi:hypothetical protein